MAWEQYNTNAEDIKQSKFDSGWFKVLKLNESWGKCRLYWRKGDYNSLKWELDLVWFELYVDAKEEQKEKWQALCNDYTESLSIKHPIKRKHQIFVIIKEMWFFLEEVESMQGLGKRYHDPMEEELD